MGLTFNLNSWQGEIEATKWGHTDTPRLAVWGSTRVSGGSRLRPCSANTGFYGYQQCDAFEKRLFLLFRVVDAPKIESLLHTTCGADGLLPSVQLMCRTYLETLKWEVLLHTPYSPDISPSDYYSFRSMAHGLSDQQFRSYKDIEKWLNSWIASKDEHFYRNGIRALLERWIKVVANDGQYIERFICNHFFTIKLHFHKKTAKTEKSHRC